MVTFVSRLLTPRMFLNSKHLNQLVRTLGHREIFQNSWVCLMSLTRAALRSDEMMRCRLSIQGPLSSYIRVFSIVMVHYHVGVLFALFCLINKF